MEKSMFENLSKKGRIEAIDLLKLFAAFLVILSHSMMKYINHATYNPLFNFIWLTQMPIFMFLAGFLNNNADKYLTIKKYLLRISKKAMILLIPCLSFLFITSILENRSIVVGFINFYKNPESNLWFLKVLFIIHLIFDFGLYISSKIKVSISFVVPVLLACLVSIVIIIMMFIFKGRFDFSTLSLKLIAYYIPFYCLGYLFFMFINSNFSQKRPIKIISSFAIAIFAVLLIIECFYFKSIHEFDDSNFKYVLIRLIGSVSSIFICLFIANIVIKFSFVLRISKFGAYSLQAYYLHILFLSHLNFSAQNSLNQWLLSLGITALLIVLVFAAMVVIYFIPFAHLIMFGKSFSFYKFEKKLPKILR